MPDITTAYRSDASGTEEDALTVRESGLCPGADAAVVIATRQTRAADVPGERARDVPPHAGSPFAVWRGRVPTRHTRKWDGLHTRHLLESTHTNTNKRRARREK